MALARLSLATKMTQKTEPNNQTRIAVFISGNGSNLQALIDHQAQNSDCPYDIALVFSNKENAYGLQRAETAGVRTKCLSHREYDSRQTFEEQIVHILHDHQIELVVLAGFMRVLSPFFVSQYAQRIINIHPSLLPKFPGLNAMEQALAARETITGCTVHLVDDGVDTGPILAQKEVSVSSDETIESLQKKIHAAEHQLYPSALAQFCEQGLSAQS